MALSCGLLEPFNCTPFLLFEKFPLQMEQTELILGFRIIMIGCSLCKAVRSGNEAENVVG
jgi:hypothetical protein